MITRRSYCFVLCEKGLSMGSKNCPKCGTSLVVSNTTANNHADHAAIHTAKHFAHKNPYVALIIGAGVLVKAAVQYFNGEYRCTICKHTFN